VQVVCKTKIVGTAIPTMQPDLVRNLVKAGMDVLRVNLAHCQASALNGIISEYRTACKSLHRVSCILCELRGGEIRSSWFIDKEKGTPCSSITLSEGQEVKLISHTDLGRDTFVGWSNDKETRIGISLERLGAVAGSSGTMIWMSDGNCRIMVTERVSDTELRGVATSNCTLESYAKVFIKGNTSRMPFLTTQDMADLKWVVQNNIDFVAVPLTRQESDVEHLRGILHKHQGGEVRCVSLPACNEHTGAGIVI
jgi:pyruvate kinase